MKEKIHYVTGERALSRSQVESVLAASRTYEEKLMMLIGFTLGLRRDDLVAIQVGNVDIQNGVLKYVEKKKKSRIRSVPMPQSLISEMKLYMRDNVENGQVYLFPAREKNTKVGHVSSRTAYTVFNDLCSLVGIETPIPIHAMRATCAKLLKERGWSIEQVAKLIGDEVATVQQYYMMPSDDEMKTVMRERGGI
jgi:integrase